MDYRGNSILLSYAFGLQFPKIIVFAFHLFSFFRFHLNKQKYNCSWRVTYAKRGDGDRLHVFILIFRVFFSVYRIVFFLSTALCSYHFFISGTFISLTQGFFAGYVGPIRYSFFLISHIFTFYFIVISWRIELATILLQWFLFLFAISFVSKTSRCIFN